jgi:hypothetical protein
MGLTKELRIMIRNEICQIQEDFGCDEESAINIFLQLIAQEENNIYFEFEEEEVLLKAA